MSSDRKDAAKHLLRAELWRRREAHLYLLDTSGPTGGQQSWVRGLDAIPPGGWAAWKIARQRGKTFTALVWTLQRMGLEANLPGVYLAQTGANAAVIVSTFLREVADDLPPEWGAKFTEGVLTLANGSELATFGTDNLQYRRSRGRKAKVVLLDESAFYADLIDVEQVYTAQLQTTGGVGLYLSSPPISPAHEFNARCRALTAAGRFVHDTFYSNPRIDHEAVIRGEMDRLGMTRAELIASTAFRREYLAEDVTEESRAAMPSWNAAIQSLLVVDRPRPEYFDAYQAFDPGKIGDPHFWLFGYLDFTRATLVIEDELEMRSASTSVRMMAELAKGVEERLYDSKAWTGKLLGAEEWQREYGTLPEYLQRSIAKDAPRQPYLRVGDNDHTTLGTLCSEHGLAIIPTRKDDKHLSVEAVNDLLRQKRIEIHPRCVRLIEQLHTTIWNKQRTEWECTAKDHGDAIDTLVYMARNVRWNRDPRPVVVPDALRGLPQKQSSGLGALKGML